MAKKKSSNADQNISNESLTEKYKNLFSIFEKYGQDSSDFLESFGGKEAFFQRIQDIEDDASDNQAEIFKQAYGDGDIRRCVRTVINLVKEDWLYHKRGIRKILYSEGNLLRNPLNYNFSADDYEITRQILIFSISNIDRLSKNEESYISKELAESSCKELIQLMHLYECLYNNRIQNEKRLKESSFLNLSLPQIFQSFLVFYQSQVNLMREEMIKSWHSQEYVTGFESEVASEKTTFHPDVLVSWDDSFEQLIEDMDTLFRYVIYLKGNDAVSLNELKEEFLTPYESPDYAMIDVLSTIDVLFARMEASFRYSDWNIGIAKDPDGRKGYYFCPFDENSVKTHFAAGLRNKYNFMIETVNEKTKELMGEPPKSNINCFDGAEQLPGGFYQEYLSVSNKLDIKDIEGFHFEIEEYKRLASYAESLIASAKKRSKSYYFTVRFNDTNLEEYLDAYVFIYTLSKVCYCAAVRSDLQEDLVPLINLEYLYNEYAAVSGLEKEKAKKLIDFYVFDKSVSRNKKSGDLFTNPLISVDSNAIFLSEGLISQVNLERNMEVFLDRNNVNLAPMGKELEKKLVEKLLKAEHLAVNTNKIDFMAYDGKNVEFDFLAVIDDYLIIMEMKSLLQPYDDDELYRRRKTILEGVSQVNRRINIVKKDWKKIKELANIELPDEPYDEEHIIKIVCTDVYDYTGLEYDGVVVTDDATVIKYFTNPYVYGIIDKKEKGVKLIKKKELWVEQGRPTAEEFMSYLHNPNTMNHYLECIGFEWKFIPAFEGDKQIAYKDMFLKEDPLKKLAQKYQM